MRKCGTCGYLILGAVDRCNRCGEALSTANVGATTVSADAHAPSSFAPPPAAPAAPRFAAPPPFAPAPAPAPDLPGAFAPTAWAPAPTPITTATSNASRAKIAIAVAILLVVGAVGATYLMHRNALPPGTSDYVKGKGVAYTAPDGSFTAEFPTPPEESTETVPAGGYSLPFTLALNSTNDYELGVGEMAFPVAIPSSVANSALDDGLKDATDAMHATMGTKANTTVDGFPAEEATAKGPDGYPVRMLAIMTKRHVYMLMVHAKTGSDRLFDTLKASFVSSESNV